MAFDARTNLPSALDRISTPILLLEEPEAHLHPISQRSMAELLSGLHGQRIVTSHSQSIACAIATSTDHPLTAIRILRATAYGPMVAQLLPAGNLTEIQKTLRILRSNQGESFFSRCTVVVEGATEQFALPVFADEFFGETDSLAMRSVTIVGAGSKNSIPGVLRVLTDLGIPAIGMIDKDGERQVLGLPHAVSDPDWEGALVSDPSRFLALDSFLNASVETFKPGRIKSEESTANNPDRTPDQRKQAAEKVEALKAQTPEQWMAMFLKRNHKDETAADVISKMLKALSPDQPASDGESDPRFPKAVQAVLRFVESTSEV